MKILKKPDTIGHILHDSIYRNYTELINSERQNTDLWLPRGRGGWGGMDWEFWIIRCKLLYTELINNKVLLYSTGNYIQYPVISYNGK